MASLCCSVADFFKDRGLKSPHNLVNKTIGLETVPQAMSKQIQRADFPLKDVGFCLFRGRSCYYAGHSLLECSIILKICDVGCKHRFWVGMMAEVP